MSLHVLLLTSAPESTDIWTPRLAHLGYDVARTGDLEQLILYARSRPAIGVLLDASPSGAATEGLADLVRRIRQEASTVDTPIVALMDAPDDPAALAGLAEAGLSGVHLTGMPESLLLHHLSAGLSIRTLRALESSGMTVQRLANETRRKIHDLSQPLAALQGRLQILQSKMSPEDPQKSRVDLMVNLTLEIGAHLRDLQEFHRQFS